MNENEFNLDFDFEKEYGVDLPKDAAAADAEADFDLRSILESDFGEDSELFSAEYEPDFDYGPETDLYVEEEEPVAEEEPDLLLPEVEEPVEEFPVEEFSEEDIPAESPVEAPVEEKPRRERKKPEAGEGSEGKPKKPVSPMRQFKNEMLPKIILGVAAALIVFFIGGSIGNTVKANVAEKEAAKDASDAAVSKEQQEKLDVQALLQEADALATGYDYDSAIALLEAAPFDHSKYPDIDTNLSSYKQIKSQLISHNDPGAIPNLSFHVLIADPARAFAGQEYSGQYNKNFVTTDEFEKILQQLYENDYVLVNMDSFISENVNGDTVTYSAKSINLPDGKKPVMITETYGYLLFMVDSDGDGEADKNGGGFASRLVVKNGEVKAEMVNSTGESVVGNYALVPILNDFIEAHPDFSYHGARATIATTGYNGVFGYRTMKSVIDTKGQAYYDEQVAGAKEVVAALKADGYEIACYTYENKDYGKLNASAIQEDMNKWLSEVTPVVGQVDTIVYAKESDISTAGDYSGSKYNVLRDIGFRFFIGSGSGSSCKITDNYVRQNRIMVTGTAMANAASTYSRYFDAKAVLNAQRGNVPSN